MTTHRDLRNTRAWWRRSQAKDPTYIKPKEDGYYWLYYHQHGSLIVQLHRHGYWHDENMEARDELEIVEGPLPYPTQAQIDSQAQHFEAARQKQWRELGDDPLWPIDELPRWDRKKYPETEPQYIIPGYYWAKFEDEKRPTLIAGFEGRWRSVDITPTWTHTNLECPPLILFGPIQRPSKDRVLLRSPSGLLS